jgi:hypothetical protein
MSFDIHRGDTAPYFDKQLRNERGKIVDISNNTEVEFHMRDADYTVVIDDDTSGNVSVEGAASGDVRYSWQASDTDTLGTYHAEFVVTFSDGRTRSFPVDGLYEVTVTEDIDD